MTTATTKAPKMSPEQVTYLAARARVEDIRKQVIDAMAAIGMTMETEAEIDDYTDAEMAIEDRLGLNTAERAEMEARAALFAWAHGKVKTLPEYRAVAGEIEGLFTGIARHPWMADRLVTISMQLRA